jgi:hypothetical protein
VTGHGLSVRGAAKNGAIYLKQEVAHAKPYGSKLAVAPIIIDVSES